MVEEEAVGHGRVDDKHSRSPKTRSEAVQVIVCGLVPAEVDED